MTDKSKKSSDKALRLGKREPRTPAHAMGLKEIPADFDDPVPEIEAMFHDGPIFPED